MYLNRKISRLFNLLMVIIIVSFSLGMIMYSDSFSFWNSPFSDLGITVAPNGKSNIISLIIFAAGMILTGITFLRIAMEFKSDKEIIRSELKASLSTLGGIGCFVFTFPHNINDNVHMIGAACFVAALWSIGTLLLIETRKTISKNLNILLQLVLQITVIGYAICYFADLPIKNIAQKFAIMGLIISVKGITNMSLLQKYNQLLNFEQINQTNPSLRGI